jgi:hypothetical protein
MLHTICLTPAIRVDQFNDHEILIVNTVRFRDSQRVSLDGLDGTPYVDDLHASLEQFVCFVGEMVRYARQRSCIRLVDVHALNWAAQGEPIGILWRWAADSVVEDKDAGCAGARKCELRGDDD